MAATAARSAARRRRSRSSRGRDVAGPRELAEHIRSLESGNGSGHYGPGYSRENEWRARSPASVTISSAEGTTA